MTRFYRSPNYDARPQGIEIDTLVLHHTNMATAELARERLCNPTAKVSAHYLISKHGEVMQLVEEEDRAWHAGTSVWRQCVALNNNSIGIELDNVGDVEFTNVQMESLRDLILAILARHPIDPRNIVGHFDIAPTRKDDPNIHFDWKWLAGNGIGLFPKEMEPTERSYSGAFGDSGAAVKSLQLRLRRWGYGIEITDRFDFLTEAVVQAFNRRYHPFAYQQQQERLWSKEADAKLNYMLEHWAQEA